MIQTIDSLFSGTADANGNYQSPPIQPCPALYGALKVVAQVNGGAARWSILVAGVPKAFPKGARVDAPILVQPNQSVVIQIANAAPNANVFGTLTGVAATTFQEVAPFISLVPNVVTLDTLGQQQQIDSFTAIAGTVITNRVYQIPAGTQSVRFQINAENLNTIWTGNAIVGGQTSDSYFTSVGSGTGGFDIWFKPSIADTTLLFSLNVSAGSPNPVNVVLTADLATNFVIASLIGAGTSSGRPLLVDNVDPAPWQVANHSLDIHSAPPVFTAWTSIIAAAPAGQSVWLHYWQLGAEGTPGSVYLSTSNVSGGVGTNPGILGEIRLSAIGVPANAFSNHGAHDFRGFNAGAGPIYWAADSSVFVGGALGYSYG